MNLPNLAFSSGGPASASDSLSPYAIPAIVKNGDKVLEDVPVESLRTSLQPVMDGLKALKLEDILDVERVPLGFGPRISDNESVKAIHDYVTPKCSDGTVRYIHLSETPGQYSIGVFIFPPRSRIPLHDHPGMCVLSRVLYGSLTRRSFDLARPQDSPSQNLTRNSWFPWSSKGRAMDNFPEGTKMAFENRIDELHAPACTMLFPFEGNLHEFVAGDEGAAVLDVLLPPYEPDHHRDCTFYDTQPCSKQEQGNVLRSATWVIPTSQPEDFHCLSGSYQGLGS